MDRNFQLRRAAPVIWIIGVAMALVATLLQIPTSAAGNNLLLATLDVCLDGCAFAQVQAAIDAAAPGDLIRVAHGTYTETITVSKAVTLEGGYSGPPDWRRSISAYPTVLDGHGVNSVIRITSGASPTIDGFIVTGGNASLGGGISVSSGSPKLSHNIIKNNYATTYGGGIYMIGRGTSPVFDGNQIISNTTYNNGGGIFVDDDASPVLINNVIARNRASSNGGGIYLDYYSKPTIVNNTIVANNLGPSWANEGIYMCNSPSPVIVNNIIYGQNCGIYGIPLTITLDYNDFWSNSSNYCGVSPGLHDISENPRFVAPGSNNYHLRWDSPMIDAGTDVGAPSSDFDDDPRPLWDGIDIGADEYAGPFSRIPLWYDDGWWLVGVNYPWLHYGHDFGQAAWAGGSWPHDGVSASASKQQVENDLAYLQSEGVHTLRLFVFGDGRASPEFDAQGYVTGFDDYFYNDLDTALSLACQHDLHLILVLIDYPWLDYPQWSGGVQMGGHADVITDTAKRQSFLDNALRPLLGRYGTNRCIIAWEVINEPEWTMNGVAGGGTTGPTVSISQMQSFVQDVVSYTHLYASQDVTLGSAQGQWLSYWQGTQLDFYQFHYYDWMGQQPPFTPYSSLGLDKPAILGEFPTSSTAITVTNFLSTTWNNGYAGALAWSLNGNDSASDFRGSADEFQGWSQAHDADVNIPQVIYADLSLAKADSPDPVIVGNPLTYTVVVTNNGYSLATGVRLTDTLPAGVPLASVTSSQGSCDSPHATVVTCPIGSLNSGEAATVTLVVTASMMGTIANTATVAGAEPDPYMTNNTDIATTTVAPIRGVILTPASAARSGNPGTTVTYALVLTNTGSATDSYTLTGGGATFTTTVIPASIGPLSAGASRNATATVQIPADAIGGASDVAAITATSQGDPTKSASSTLTTTVDVARKVFLPLVLR
jgi:uncharacterized repeat protein (TIGR01451 family)